MPHIPPSTVNVQFKAWGGRAVCCQFLLQIVAPPHASSSPCLACKTHEDNTRANLGFTRYGGNQLSKPN